MATFAWHLQQLASLSEARENELAQLRSQLATFSTATSQPVQLAASQSAEALAFQPVDGEMGEAIPEEKPVDQVKFGIPPPTSASNGRKRLGHKTAALLQVRERYEATKSRAHTFIEGMREDVRRSSKHRATEYWMDESGADKGRCSLIMQPNDPARVFWDLAGMCLLFYDIVAIPLAAFDPDPHWFTNAMDWITQIFWTIDMLMSLLTGYVHEGVVITKPSMILKNYLKTWFILDLAVCGPDWVSTIVEMSTIDYGSDPGGVNRLLRSLRVVRTIRLLRLVKLKRILTTIKDRITSEVVFIMLNIAKLIVMLLLVNHFIASTWYLVGSFDSVSSWVKAYGMRKEDADLGYRYGTSLHWSLTQFTPASMEVQPQNVFERYFAIMVLIAGLVLFSSFISSITGSMSQLRNMKAEKSKQFWLLRHYLKQQRVPRDLCFRVLRYVEYATNNVNERVPEGRITILSCLTDQLRNELNFFTHYKRLTSHSMFFYIRRQDEAILNRMSNRVLRSKELAAGDPLFSLVDAASDMFFILTGSIRYDPVVDRQRSNEQDLSMSGDEGSQISPVPEVSVVLNEEDYLCEVALWTEWMHVGTAEAVEEVSLISIDAESFGDLVCKAPEIHQVTTVYAQRFVKYLSEELDWVEVSREGAKLFTRGFFFRENFS